MTLAPFAEHGVYDGARRDIPENRFNLVLAFGSAPTMAESCDLHRAYTPLGYLGRDERGRGPIQGDVAGLIVGKYDLMAVGLVGIVLAAGHGNRLRPLTDEVPKALCPVNNEPLLRRCVGYLSGATEAIAVNVHAHRGAIVDFVAPLSGVKVSVEEPEALGTAGGIARLRPWIAGRDVVVCNADAWFEADPVSLLVDGWDGARMRLLVSDEGGVADFGPYRYIGAGVLPWGVVRRLSEEVSGLYEVLWKAAMEAGTLDFVEYPGRWFDCGTPRRYLEANLFASGDATVVGPGAVVEGTAERSVLWAGARVAAGEYLYEAIRTGSGVTVQTVAERC
jgi:N-acetyl-alpha-D-muramate 1-phosphate uridylyltransferase